MEIDSNVAKELDVEIFEFLLVVTDGGRDAIYAHEVMERAESGLVDPDFRKAFFGVEVNRLFGYMSAPGLAPELEEGKEGVGGVEEAGFDCDVDGICDTTGVEAVVEGVVWAVCHTDEDSPCREASAVNFEDFVCCRLGEGSTL